MQQLLDILHSCVCVLCLESCVSVLHLEQVSVGTSPMSSALWPSVAVCGAGVSNEDRGVVGPLLAGKQKRRWVLLDAGRGGPLEKTDV